MTGTEFCEWVVHHNLRFPGFAAWADRNQLMDGDAPALKATEFGEATLEEARKATNALAEGDDHPPFGRQLLKISNQARFAATRRIEAARFARLGTSRAYRCATCRDQGMLMVRFREGVIPQRFVEHYGQQRAVLLARAARHFVACDCELGKQCAASRGCASLDRERMESEK